MTVLGRVVAAALDAAREAVRAGSAGEWERRAPPVEYVRHAGPVTMVAHPMHDAPAVLDCSVRLSVWVALDGGGRLLVAAIYAATIAEARAIGDRLLAAEMN